jgi:hypothetical protein
MLTLPPDLANLVVAAVILLALICLVAIFGDEPVPEPEDEEEGW